MQLPTQASAADPWRRHDATLNELFDATVLANPDHVALDSQESALTYSELQRWSNNVAAIVIDNGISRGDRVFVLNDNCLLSPAIVLGLGRAAAVGVRPNPDDPVEFLRLILEDSGARLIVATGSQLELAHALAGSGIRVALLDPGQFQERSMIRSRTHPDDRVWIAYTSGSTGRPKGVTHTERSVMGFVSSYIATTGLSRSDRVARLHEVRGMDMFSALIVGASSHDFNLSVQGFTGIGRWLSERQITILPTVPTVLRYIVKELRSQPRELALRLLRLSGEPLTRADLAQAATVFPETCRILNWYGSTEVAVASRTFSFADLTEVSSIPVGRVFDNIEVEIIDNHGAAVDGPEVGEIAVKSDVLFEGYWNRPDLDTSAFSTVNDQSGCRRFNTGDTGFIDAAGELHICGRKDEQIKVSGFRVEPGEIEAALRAMPGISDAAIVPVKGKLGNDSTTELAAYVEVDPAHTPTVEAIRDYLRALVPSYKVPAYYVRVADIPKLGSGKTDKRSLPRFVPVSRLDYNTAIEPEIPGGGSN